MNGEWILSCPVCLGEDFGIDPESIDATVCIACGTWYNDINDSWYLKSGMRLPQESAGHRWIIKD